MNDTPKKKSKEELELEDNYFDRARNSFLEKKFCHKCGNKLIFSEEFTNYDTQTGKESTAWFLLCSSRKGLVKDSINYIDGNVTSEHLIELDVYGVHKVNNK